MGKPVRPTYTMDITYATMGWSNAFSLNSQCMKSNFSQSEPNQAAFFYTNANTPMLNSNFKLQVIRLHMT